MYLRTARMFFKTLIFLTVVNDAFSFYNGSFFGRTFSRKKLVTNEWALVTDEPIDFRPDYTDEEINRPSIKPGNGSGPGQMERNYTMTYAISVTANDFLTGRVSTIFIPTLYTIVFLISMPLNTIAMVTFVRRIRPMKPAVIYMLNLAAADLLFSMLLPFKIVSHYSGNDWGFGEGLCRLVTAGIFCNMYCSILLMTCISVDRLLAVAYPIASLGWRRPSSAALACGIMWVLAVGGTLPLVLSRQTLYDSSLGITTCHDVQDEEMLKELYVFFFPILSCVLYFLPILVIVICYSRVVQVLNKASSRFVDRFRQKTRAVVMAVTVLLVCVVCFMPTNAILLAHYLQITGHVGGEPDNTHVAYLLSLCLGSISCCLDPLIYCFGSSQCRRQLMGVLGSWAATKGRNGLSRSSRSSRSSSGSNKRTSTTITKVDAFHASLNSQYNKLLV
ncbi:hypothetical protein DPEC_G00324810 [Dallia pectoralis]|uniref:Uncharacterized protein n=1 Tax=Dallia pectoralis TaxID=75939 RepID=A0ACC2FB30_DALPE|nr:hypothetical protein DPEC_G00324810 [Dallia pectoralis]